MFASSVSASIEYNKNLYFPGETVCGVVQLTLFKERSIKGIQLEVLGNSSVKWTESTHSKENSSEDYIANEEYYDMKFNLLQSGPTDNLPIGTYNYGFNFILPYGIPSSFESEFGHVRHICKAVINVENKIFDVKCCIPFSVGASYDLNFLPEAKIPILFTKEKTVCCMCCKGGEISFTLRISHSGFACGENIIIDGECSNRSSYKKCHAEIQILQVITYKTSSKEKKVTNVVARKSHTKFQPGEDDIWTNEYIRVPPLPPTGLIGCNIIDMKYELKFILHLSGIGFSLSSSSPLYIGTIPLRERFENLRSNNSFAPTSNAYHFHSGDGGRNPGYQPSAPAQEAYPWAEQYPDLPPPAYEECMKSSAGMKTKSGKDSSEEEIGDQSASFLPCYVSYAWKN